MPDISPAITIILAEASILLSLLCGFFIFKHFHHHHNDNKAILNLSNTIQDNSDERKKMLQRFLAETCNYEEDAAQQTSNMLINTEKLFYKTIMDIYKKRDANALKSLDSNTEHMIDAYRSLASGATAALKSKLEQEKVEKHELLLNNIQELEQHNQSLAKELGKLKAEMDTTVSEYTSAFHQNPNEAPSDNEIKPEDTGDSQDSAPDSDNNVDTSPMIDEDLMAILESPDDETENSAADLAEESTPASIDQPTDDIPIDTADNNEVEEHITMEEPALPMNTASDTSKP